VLTEEMLQRSKAFKPSARWTEYVRSQYGGAADAKVVVAWDTQLSRWVLAYEASDHVVTAGGAYPVKWLKAFYLWQGVGDTYLPPGPEMVKWLRKHDIYSDRTPEAWHKRAVAPDKKLAEDKERSHWDNVKYEFKCIYDAHGKPVSSQVGPMSHNLGKGPNAGSKYFGPGKHNIGWKDDAGRTETTSTGSAG